MQCEGVCVCTYSMNGCEVCACVTEETGAVLNHTLSVEK